MEIPAFPHNKSLKLCVGSPLLGRAASPSPFRPRHPKDCEHLGNSALPQTRNLHNSAARAPVAAEPPGPSRSHHEAARGAKIFTNRAFPDRKSLEFGVASTRSGRDSSPSTRPPRSLHDGENSRNSRFSQPEIFTIRQRAPQGGRRSSQCVLFRKRNLHSWAARSLAA